MKKNDEKKNDFSLKNFYNKKMTTLINKTSNKSNTILLCNIIRNRKPECKTILKFMEINIVKTYVTSTTFSIGGQVKTNFGLICEFIKNRIEFIKYAKQYGYPTDEQMEELTTLCNSTECTYLVNMFATLIKFEKIEF